MDAHPPPRCFKGLEGKLRIIHLGFLQAEQIGLVGLQPAQHLVKPGAHGIDIPGSDLHGAVTSGRDA